MAEGGIMGGLRMGSISGSGDDPRSSVMVRSSSIAAALLSCCRQAVVALKKR
jgi:hypothetical protein